MRGVCFLLILETVLRTGCYRCLQILFRSFVGMMMIQKIVSGLVAGETAGSAVAVSDVWLEGESNMAGCQKQHVLRLLSCVCIALRLVSG
jgi:hypothetical protein